MNVILSLSKVPANGSKKIHHPEVLADGSKKVIRHPEVLADGSKKSNPSS
jgi:hypothetical protein